MASPRRKLTDKDVRQARTAVRRLQNTAYSDGIISWLAKRHHVSGPTMWMAVRGVTWKHIPGAVPMQKRARGGTRKTR